MLLYLLQPGSLGTVTQHFRRTQGHSGSNGQQQLCPLLPPDLSHLRLLSSSSPPPQPLSQMKTLRLRDGGRGAPIGSAPSGSKASPAPQPWSAPVPGMWGSGVLWGPRPP